MPPSPVYASQQLLTWLMTLPGAPMIYYGDEYGERGGVDPNNRVDWRGDSSSLSADEQATLAWARKVGTARHQLAALRRGAYVPVYNTDENVLIFARQDSVGDVALVAISKLTTSTTVTAPLPQTLGLADGTVLHDALGGPDVTVTGGSITVTVGAQSAAILGTVVVSALDGGPNSSKRSTRRCSRSPTAALPGGRQCRWRSVRSARSPRSSIPYSDALKSPHIHSSCARAATFSSDCAESHQSACASPSQTITRASSRSIGRCSPSASRGSSALREIDVAIASGRAAQACTPQPPEPRTGSGPSRNPRPGTR